MAGLTQTQIIIISVSCGAAGILIFAMVLVYCLVVRNKNKKKRAKKKTQRDMYMNPNFFGQDQRIDPRLVDPRFQEDYAYQMDQRVYNNGGYFPDPPSQPFNSGGYLRDYPNTQNASTQANMDTASTVGGEKTKETQQTPYVIGAPAMAMPPISPATSSPYSYGFPYMGMPYTMPYPQMPFYQNPFGLNPMNPMSPYGIGSPPLYSSLEPGDIRKRTEPESDDDTISTITSVSDVTKTSRSSRSVATRKLRHQRLMKYHHPKRHPGEYKYGTHQHHDVEWNASDMGWHDGFDYNRFGMIPRPQTSPEASYSGTAPPPPRSVTGKPTIEIYK